MRKQPLLIKCQFPSAGSMNCIWHARHYTELNWVLGHAPVLLEDSWLFLMQTVHLCLQWVRWGLVYLKRRHLWEALPQANNCLTVMSGNTSSYQHSCGLVLFPSFSFSNYSWLVCFTPDFKAATTVLHMSLLRKNLQNTHVISSSWHGSSL